MPIAARCPHCFAELRARDALAGRPVRCTKCGGLLTLPGEPVTASQARTLARKGGSKLPMVLLVVGGAGLLLGCLVCSGVGALFYFAVAKTEVVTTVPQPAPVAESRPEEVPAATVATPPPPPAVKRPKLGVPAASVASVEISGEFLKNAAVAEKKYAGKILRVRGSVIGHTGNDTVVLEGEFDAKQKGRRLVTCKVHPADLAALADVRPRATVTLIGKCTGQTKGTNAVAFTDCLFEE